MIRITFAALTAVALVGCATTTEPVPADVSDVVDAEDAPFAVVDPTKPETLPPVSGTLSEFDRAMQTVEELMTAGSAQGALTRLDQLVGKPTLSREEMAEVLVRRGEIRMSNTGFDTWGAIKDFNEVRDNYADTDWVTAAQTALDTANGKATSLNFALNQPETSRMQKFDALMQLGDHDEAIDLMIAFDLEPNNDVLLAMYDIGYLCEGDTLTGRTYSAVDTDGDVAPLQFCDFGK